MAVSGEHLLLLILFEEAELAEHVAGGGRGAVGGGLELYVGEFDGGTGGGGGWAVGVVQDCVALHGVLLLDVAILAALLVVHESAAVTRLL